MEDDANDQLLIQRGFEQNNVACAIHCVSSGTEAIAYLNGDGRYSDRSRFPYPSFIMTDLHMPCGNGLSVLEHLRGHPQWRIIPTLVFSSSVDPDDVNESYLLGASAYVVKPTEMSELRRFLRLFYEFWVLCEGPQVDGAGKWMNTQLRGRLSEKPTGPL